MALLAVVVAGIAVLWLACLVRVLTNPDRYRNGTQLIWVLVLLLSGPVGAVLYLSLGPQREPAAREPLPGRRERLSAIADPWHDDSVAPADLAARRSKTAR